MITSEEWQELCEWAGFERIDGNYGYKKGEFHPVYYLPQDMNTLFKWIWPRIPTDKREVILNMVCLVLIDDPFEALAQAIYKVVNPEERERE